MLSPSRRTFLTMGAFAATLLVSGCTDDSHHDGRNNGGATDADRPLRVRAVAATDTLLAAYDGLLAGPGAGQADLLRQLRAEVAEHRAQLAQGLPSASASASTSASASASAPAGAPGSVAALAAVERQTALARLADLDAASPAFAKLLASVSASDALHAVALGDNGSLTPTGQPSPSGKAAPLTALTALTAGTTAGLQSALAAEHAAVYGYGVVGAFLPPGPQREDGRTSYAAHQARRDAWQRIIAGNGTTPSAAAAGYRLPFQVKDAAGAARLAAHIETQLTVAYADLVAATTGPLRTEAAGALREAVLRAQHWGAEPPALPGITVAEPASPSAAPSASQSA